ncbi:hypothetical protein ACIBO1_18620 [Micromonospora sp. NPDC049903]|uniref:hypothetical protein n=1 Tax=Micromonospora sp. NPDC049903 TaxID=3364276 RepID=UPI0037B10E98
MGVRPGDWSPLTLSGDPTPGDPDVLVRVADYMDVMARHAQTADDGLGAVLRQSGEGAFVGKTADWLREQVSKELRGFVAGVRTAFTAAGPAIRAYAQALREAQAKADQALREASAAGDDEERIRTLKADAESAAADVRSAAGTARQAILDATDHITSPVTPKSACEVFWEIFNWLAIIVTVVAIFVGGPLGLLAFAMNAALAMKAALDFATGKTNALGLALGLLAILGPSTRPLIALGDLTKLATTAWRNITQFSRNSFTLARAGIDDFWRTVSTLSISAAVRGIGDLGITVANSVKNGALLIPRIVGPLDGLAVRGFVTLEKFTLVTVPATAITLGNLGYRGLVRLGGLAADGGRFVAVNAVRFGNLMVREFGGWKWLRIFLPLAGHEIGAVGLSGAAKLGILGRGLGMSRFDSLAGLGGGVRLANGLTTVHVVKPGDAPPAGGLHVSPSGLHLPDLIEKPLIGAPSTPHLAFSARSVDLSAMRGPLGAHDLAAVSPPRMPAMAGGVDLGALPRFDPPTVTGATIPSHVDVPTPGAVGAVHLPDVRMGNLGALNRAGGLEGLETFGRAELRHLHTGDVSAVRTSETAVAFNLGAPEKAFGDTTVVTPTSVAVPHTPPTAQVSHLHALDQLKQAQRALTDASGDALAVARAEKDVRVAEALVRRTSDSLRIDGPGVLLDAPPARAVETAAPDLAATPPTTAPDLAAARASVTVDEATRALQARLDRLRGGDAVDLSGLDVTHRFAPVSTTDLLDLPSVPTHQPGTGVAELESRLAALRGTDVPSPSARHLELEHRFARLRPGSTGQAGPVDPAMFPAPPTISPAEATARATAVERLADLEVELAAVRAEGSPSTADPTRATRDAAAPVTPEVHGPGRTVNADQVGTPGRPVDAGARAADELPDLPAVPRTDPVVGPGPDELGRRLAELTDDARRTGLTEREVSALTTDVRAALDTGRHGDAAHGITALHDRIDRHALFQRLDSYREHVDAGHRRAAQLGMDKGTWLQHAVDIERAAAAGRTDDLHRLLNAYENTLADRLGQQKLADRPDGAPGRADDEAGSPGDLDDLTARLDALRGDHTPDPRLADLELEARLAALRGTDDAGAPLPELPDVPTRAPGGRDVDADLADRLATLRARADESIGMPPAERAEWDSRFAQATDEAAHADVLARHELRLAELTREVRLAEVRGGTGPLSADEYRSWQEALSRVGDDPAGIDRVLSRYDLRLDQHRLDDAHQIHAALSAPDHLRGLDSRLDQALGGLSQSLRDSTATRFTTLGDRLAQLRGTDGVPAPSRTDLPASPRAELPTAPRTEPSVPGRVEPAGARTSPAPGLKEPPPRTPEAPSRPAPTPGEALAELPAPPRLSDDALTAPPGDRVDAPPRDLLGDGRPTGGGRTVEVNSERWTPLKDAFRFEPAGPGQPPKVVRPPASGERVNVGYQVTVAAQDMHFTVKVHLDAAPSVAARELAEVKARTVEGIERYVNAPRHHLPGWDVPMKVTVQFVDDRAEAHGSVSVGPAGSPMSQQSWPVGAPPAAYAHEIVHQLGVKDTIAPPGALLHGASPQTYGDLMGGHRHDVDEFVLTPGALGQIADVLAPHVSDSSALRPPPGAVVGDLAEEFWASGVDLPPRLTSAEATESAPTDTVSTPAQSTAAPIAPIVVNSAPPIAVPATVEEIPLTVVSTTPQTANSLPGLYRERPELLNDLDAIDDVDELVRGVEESVTDAVRTRVSEKLPLVPGLSKLSVQTAEIGQALRDEPDTFFGSGGRSFDVRDGLHGWHRVTIAPEWSPKDAQVVDQSVDRAKFDTRSDQADGVKHSATTGGSGALGVGTMFPQRVGYGAGGALDVALSRPLESFEDGAKLTDSHNVRSGSGSHLVSTPAAFTVTVTDPEAPLTSRTSPVTAPKTTDSGPSTTDTGPKPTETGPKTQFSGPKTGKRTVGEAVRADVTFRSSDDIAKAAPRQTGWLEVDPSRHTSMLVENFTPVRILRAGIDLPDGTRPVDTWNDVVEDILVRLHPTKAVGPGTLGARQARDLFKESAMIGNLMPAMDTVVHPPTITSKHGAHAVSLEFTANMPALSVLADIAKSSFRWQPGQSEGTKLSHSSRVGLGLSLVPIRWAFGTGYVQARFSWGYLRSMTASAGHGGSSKLGTEFKDIPNVLVEARFRLDISAGLREAPGSRLAGDGTVRPIVVDLVVLGRLPAARAAELLSGDSTIIPSPTTWYVPPYAYTGGRSVTYGLSAFQQLYLDVAGLIRTIEGGFLPRFGDSGTTRRMRTSRAAIERQANQDELDRVLTVPGLRQGKGNLFKNGVIAELSRTKKFGSRHVIVHVTASYTKAFQHLGTSKGDAVRTSHTDVFQEKISAGGQWRGAAAAEGGVISRLTGSPAGALVPAGAIEFRGRLDRQSGSQLSGQETRLNGGTPDSQAFGNDLQVTVQLYAYTKRLGRDPKGRIGLGRVMRQRFPRPATDTAGPRRVVAPKQEPSVRVGGKQFSRFRLTQTHPVTVQFDQASVLHQPLSLPTTFAPRPDPLGVDRQTKLELTTLREWVDQGPTSRVDRWLSVEDFPGSAFVLVLAKDAIRASQQYTDDVSRTKLGDLRGTDGLAEGMPVWAGLIDRFGESRQIHGLPAMVDGTWHVDRITSGEDGAATDLAVSTALTNPRLVPTYATITNEFASTGSVEVNAARTKENQLALRGTFSGNVRRTGTSSDNTHGGGALFTGGYEKLLYAGSTRHSESIGGAIERNANNRKGKQRSFLVVFDMRASVAAEITTSPDRYALVPQSLRTGDWLHHHKSVTRHGTVTNALFLRLPARTVVQLGLLPRLAGDPGMIGDLWLPGPMPSLRLPPGHSPGLGLYTFDRTPTLTEPMITALRAEAAKLGPDRGMVRKLLDTIQGQIVNRSIAKISDSLSGSGLDDPMLNRRRLLYLFTPAGGAQHWSSMVDGGVSVLHTKPGRMTQHSRDVRLIAEPIGEPKVRGFVADHDDVDIKTTHTSDHGVTRQRMHGQTLLAGVAGTGVSNHHGENLAAGMGDTVGRVSQVSNAQNSGTTTTDTNLSSGRGVKARLETRVKYTLAVFDDGKRVDGDLLVVYDTVTQDRWADDLRPPRVEPAKAPATYRIAAPETLPPGWRTVNGMPMPPRFSAEDLNRLAQVQRLVEGLLTDAAKRLRTDGYAGAHQIHQSLTPEILLPGVPKMMTGEGFDLPPAVSAQIFGQQATINLKLVPEGASLGGVSSGVFREHAPQQSGGYSTGTSVLTQHLRIPRIPLIGRGFADDPYQALEAGGPGVAAGDTQAAAESGSNATGSLGNVKPESRSTLVDYLSRVEVTVSLAYSMRPARTVTSASKPAELVNVSLRMGLHDARTALHIPTDATTIATDSPGRVAAFDEIVDHEAKLATAAESFVSATDRLDQARYDAYAAAEGSAERAALEATLPGLHEQRDRAGQAWWELLQRHHLLLDDFRHSYLGITENPAGTKPARLAEHIAQQSNGTTGTKGQPPATKDETAPATMEEPEPTTSTEVPGPEGTQVETTEVGTAAPQVLPTPGDGRCQLYATIGSAPELVSAKLAEAGLGSPALHAWLGDPEAVRSQVTAATTSPLRNSAGLVPLDTELGQAAELLRQLVDRHLHTLGPDGVPVAAMQGYRLSGAVQMQEMVQAMSREALLDRLAQLGITTLQDPGLLPATHLRDLFVELRTADLVTQGWEPGAARAYAEQKVPLKPTKDGSPPRDLADDSLSMRTMFDYLRARGTHVELRTLSDAILRDQLATYLLDPLRPVDAAEFTTLTRAVRHWEDHWRDDVGEAYPALVASALDAQVRIHTPEHTETIGPDGAPLLDVFRRSDHYQAMVGPQPQPEPEPEPVESTPPAAPFPADLDRTSGPAVHPKGAKPFEVDPPGSADGKTITGDALRTQQMRVNPAWMPLSDFTPEIHAGRPDARWHYVVTEAGEIMIGSEEILTVVSARQLADLHAAMRATDPGLTLDQLRNSINQQGHPTIGVRFDGEGRALVGRGRISGELHRDPDTGRWGVDDKSGRYMSEKIRPGLDPADVQRWLDDVAARLTAQLGEIVEARPYKHAAPAPATRTGPTDGTAPAPPTDDLRARWVEVQAQRLRADGTDPTVATIIAEGLTADRETMLADLAARAAP